MGANKLLGGSVSAPRGQWWPLGPPTWESEGAEHVLLQEYADYVRFGGRHPSLPPELSDSSATFFQVDFCKRWNDPKQIKVKQRRTRDWR